MPIRANARALGEFAASRHGTFSLRQAADHDISAKVVARMVDDGTVERLRNGIYRFIAAEQDWRARTYGAVVGLRAVGSHFTATALHVVDGLCRAPLIPELLCHHDDPVEVRGALVRRTRCLPRCDVTEIDGIACTTLERTLIDVAPMVTHRQLVRAIDDAQRRGIDMHRLIERAVALSRRGRSGPSLVLDIARRRLDGYRLPDSYFERLVEACVQSPVIGEVVRQYELRTPSGLFVARFDLAVPWVRLGIEAHSRSFHLGQLVEQYDEDRDLRATQQGWDITYLGFAATRAPSAVRRDIELVVEQRARDLGLSRNLGG
jgi:hypothetical protein